MIVDYPQKMDKKCRNCGEIVGIDAAVCSSLFFRLYLHWLRDFERPHL